ncbi:MAG TPA: class II aldolase/adducin family protein [Fastidiosipila sp.]|nr:class II aldolase/adducin family protein [Fastidiosipila sp.]
MSNQEAIAREIVEIGKLMYERGHVISNDGNISAKVADDLFLVTPSGISKGRLTTDMLVPVNAKGEVLSGNRHPSSETPMHLEVYRQKSEVKAVVHAHSPLATAFAIAGRAIDEPYMPELILGLGVVPVAPFAMPSTEEVPASIIGLLEGNALLLSNHGVLTWGSSLIAAFDYLEQVEYAAKIIMTVEQLGGGRKLDEKVRERLFSLADNYRRLAGERKTDD